MLVTNPHPKITVYDDVFDWNLNKSIMLNCTKVPYFIGWQDSFDENEAYLHSRITKSMWQERYKDQSLNDFLDPLATSGPFMEMNQELIEQTVVNCDTTYDSHTVHTHPKQDVILYYVNNEWKDGWGGETFFYDPNGKEILYTSPYTPNRMIKFDGEIVHRFNGPSRIGPKFRFSISTFFIKED